MTRMRLTIGVVVAVPTLAAAARGAQRVDGHRDRRQAVGAEVHALEDVRGGAVTFRVTNKGKSPHDFKISRQEVRPARAGQDRGARCHAEEGQGGVPLHPLRPCGRGHEGHAHRQARAAFPGPVRRAGPGAAIGRGTATRYNGSRERHRHLAGHDRARLQRDPRPRDPARGADRAARDPRRPGPHLYWWDWERGRTSTCDGRGRAARRCPAPWYADRVPEAEDRRCCTAGGCSKPRSSSGRSSR